MSSKQVWSSIAMLAFAFLAPMAVGLIASGLTGFILTGAVMIGGGMILSRELAASQPKTPNTSQVYSWNPQTLQQAGGTMPKCYGRNRLHGNIIACYTAEVNTLNATGTTIVKSEQQLNLLIDFGEGPVEGLVDDSVLINGQPSASWPDVTTQFKRGTLNQTAATAFASELPIEIPVGIPVDGDGGTQVYSTPDKHFDDLEIVINFPEGIFRRRSDGNVDAQAVSIKIELSVKDAGSWTTLVEEDVTGRSYYPIRKTYRASETYTGGTAVTITRGQQYDLRVTNNEPDREDDPENASRFGDQVEIYAIREIVSVGFTYPGRVLLALTALATDELNGSLDVSVEFDGAIVNTDMTGGTTLAYSTNPAHVLYDLLTGPVISGDGDGEAYAVADYHGPCEPSDPIISTFATLESYADALVDDGDGGTEKRLTFDGFFDERSTVGDGLTDVCAVSRCHLIWRGRRPYIQIDTARNPVALLSDGNCRRRAWTESLIPTTERASEVEVTYRDALSDYDQTPVLVRNTAMAGSHKVTLQVNGITKQSRAVRIMNFELLRNQYVTRQLRTAMQCDGFVLEPGDVVYAQRPRRSWGGRLQAVSDRRVRLDRHVRRTKADRIIVQTYDGGAGTWTTESHAVRWIDGRTLEIKDDWTIVPKPEDVYLFGPDGISSDLFEITDVRRAGELEFTIDMITYDSRVFGADAALPTIVTDVGVSRAQRGSTSISAPASLADVQNANPPGVEFVSDTPDDGIISLKTNVRLYADANNVVHLQRLESGVWVDQQLWGSASSSSSSSSVSSSSSSSSSSSLSSSSSSSGGA